MPCVISSFMRYTKDDLPEIYHYRIQLFFDEVLNHILDSVELHDIVRFIFNIFYSFLKVISKNVIKIVLNLKNLTSVSNFFIGPPTIVNIFFDSEYTKSMKKYFV